MRTFLIGLITTLLNLSVPVDGVSQTTLAMDGPYLELNEQIFVGASTLFRFEVKPDEAIQYSIDSGKWINYKKPFAIEKDGKHLLFYRSASDEQDPTGKQVTIMVDTSKPVLSAALIYKSVTLRKYQNDNQRTQNGTFIECPIGSEIHANASDPGAGLKSLEIREDNAPLQPFSNPLRLQGRGKHTYKIVARDFVGNSVEATILLELFE